MINVTIFCVLRFNSTQDVIYMGLTSDGESSEIYLGGWLTYKSQIKGIHIIAKRKLKNNVT